jgi:hypothetical protein
LLSASNHSPPALRLSRVDDADLPARVNRLGQGEILLVQVGSVPQSVFEFIFSQASLPATVAGANATDLARSLGKMYLDTEGIFNQPYYGKRGPLTEADKRLMADANAGLQGRGPNISARIAFFLAKALDPGSRLRKSYEALRPQGWQSDKLAIGLLLAAEKMSLRKDSVAFAARVKEFYEFARRRELEAPGPIPPSAPASQSSSFLRKSGPASRSRWFEPP